MDSASGVTHLSFTIDDADNGLTLAQIAYASQAVNMSYTGTATLSGTPNGTATAAPSSTATVTSAGSDLTGRPRLAMLLGVVGLLLVL